MSLGLVGEGSHEDGVPRHFVEEVEAVADDSQGCQAPPLQDTGDRGGFIEGEQEDSQGRGRDRSVTVGGANWIGFIERPAPSHQQHSQNQRAGSDKDERVRDAADPLRGQTNPAQPESEQGACEETVAMGVGRVVEVVGSGGFRRVMQEQKGTESKGGGYAKPAKAHDGAL